MKWRKYSQMGIHFKDFHTLRVATKSVQEDCCRGCWRHQLSSLRYHTKSRHIHPLYAQPSNTLKMKKIYISLTLIQHTCTQNPELAALLKQPNLCSDVGILLQFSHAQLHQGHTAPHIQPAGFTLGRKVKNSTSAVAMEPKREVRVQKVYTRSAYTRQR